MEVFGDAVTDILNRSIQAFIQNDIELAQSVEPLEEVIDDLNKEVKKRHVKRLRKGKCTIETGLVLSDIAVNYERVADHCSNLAVYMIQMEDNTVEAHGYVTSLSGKTRREVRTRIGKINLKPLKSSPVRGGRHSRHPVVVRYNRYAGRLCQFWDYEAFPGNRDYYGGQHRYHYDVMAFEPDRD